MKNIFTIAMILVFGITTASIAQEKSKEKKSDTKKTTTTKKDTGTKEEKASTTAKDSKASGQKPDGYLSIQQTTVLDKSTTKGAKSEKPGTNQLDKSTPKGIQKTSPTTKGTFYDEVEIHVKGKSSSKEGKGSTKSKTDANTPEGYFLYELENLKSSPKGETTSQKTVVLDKSTTKGPTSYDQEGNKGGNEEATKTAMENEKASPKKQKSIKGTKTEPKSTGSIYRSITEGTKTDKPNNNELDKSTTKGIQKSSANQNKSKTPGKTPNDWKIERDLLDKSSTKGTKTEKPDTNEIDKSSTKGIQRQGSERVLDKSSPKAIDKSSPKVLDKSSPKNLDKSSRKGSNGESALWDNYTARAKEAKAKKSKSSKKKSKKRKTKRAKKKKNN